MNDKPYMPLVLYDDVGEKLMKQNPDLDYFVTVRYNSESEKFEIGYRTIVEEEEKYDE